MAKHQKAKTEFKMIVTVGRARITNDIKKRTQTKHRNEGTRSREGERSKMQDKGKKMVNRPIRWRQTQKLTHDQ